MNIAEILKDCPKGTKLYSPVFGEVVLKHVDNSGKYPINCIKNNGLPVLFTSDGRLFYGYPDDECVLFQSKDQRDWSKFEVSDQESKHQFKPFDKVLVRDSDHSKWECDIFSHFGDEEGIFVCISDWWRQCIPYEGNEHLLGTTIK